MSFTKEKMVTSLMTLAIASTDDSIQENVRNASGVGLEVKVRRIYDGVGVHDGKDPCYWCIERCGTFTVDEAYYHGVFQRHDGCGCTIEYTSKKGVRTYQTGKSSPKNWLSEEQFKRRRDYGLLGEKMSPQTRIINAAIEMQIRDNISKTLVDAIMENHDALKSYTPEDMKKRLEIAGYEVKPLADGSLKGKAFEEGGGYKINFGGDGIFQYHPAERSHHGGAYWKIKNGPTGRRGVHYDMAGNEI